MGIIRKVKHIEDCSLGGVAQVLPIFTICERMSSEFNFSYDSKYAVYRYDRRGGLTGGGGGGVLALIHKRILYRILSESDFCSEIQLLVLEIEKKRSDVLLLLCYRSPSCTSNAFTQFIGFLSQVSEQWSNHIILKGDFKFPTIDWDQYG